MAEKPSETQLLLDALRLNQTAEAWQAACARANVAWESLAVRAIALGLAPQLHHRLVEWNVALPPRAAAKLAVTYQAHAQRNAAIFAQLGEVLEAFQQRGLRPIALKGVHLAALVYPQPALRPMNDIDLLFTPTELPQAEAVLDALGYGGKRKSPDVGPGVVKHTSTFKRESGEAATPNPYLSPEAGRMIEPHTSLEEAWFGLKVDITPGVRERAVEVTLGGQPVRVLADIDLLLHLCVHFCFHVIAGSPAMVQLLDLKAVTARANALSWPAFVQRARERGAAPYALAALSLAHQLLDASVAHVLPELARSTPPHLRRYIARLGLPELIRRTQQKPLITLMDRLRRGLSDRAEAARWATHWREVWRVWATALRVGHTDTGRWLLTQVQARLRGRQA